MEQLDQLMRIDAIRRRYPLEEVMVSDKVNREARTTHLLARSQSTNPPIDRRPAAPSTWMPSTTRVAPVS